MVGIIEKEFYILAAKINNMSPKKPASPEDKEAEPAPNPLKEPDAPNPLKPPEEPIAPVSTGAAGSVSSAGAARPTRAEKLTNIGAWTVIGAVMGTLFGAILGNYAYGLVIGLVLGVVVGSIASVKAARK